MPLPEKIIDELSKSKPITPGWSWRIFMFSIFVFIIVFSFYIGLNFGFKNYLNSKISKLDNELKQLMQSISEGDQNKIILFYSQAANISDILKDKKNTIQVFQWLEKNTLEDISLNKFNFNNLSNQLSLGGFSNSRDSILNQVLVFQNLPEVDNVVLNNLNLNQNIWQFDLIILFKESVLNANQ